MNTSVWGKVTWDTFLLAATASDADPEAAKYFVPFMQACSGCLACEPCRRFYSHIITSAVPEPDQSWVSFLFDVFSIVNAKVAAGEAFKVAASVGAVAPRQNRGQLEIKLDATGITGVSASTVLICFMIMCVRAKQISRTGPAAGTDTVEHRTASIWSAMVLFAEIVKRSRPDISARLKTGMEAVAKAEVHGSLLRSKTVWIIPFTALYMALTTLEDGPRVHSASDLIRRIEFGLMPTSKYLRTKWDAVGTGGGGGGGRLGTDIV